MKMEQFHWSRDPQNTSLEINILKIKKSQNVPRKYDQKRLRQCTFLDPKKSASFLERASRFSLVENPNVLGTIRYFFFSEPISVFSDLKSFCSDAHCYISVNVYYLCLKQIVRL